MNSESNEPNEINIDELLEKENSQNKTESWNKLNKTLKIQMLHKFSEKYGKQHKHSAKEIKQLKHFFSNALENSKLQKAKDVIYDKSTQEVMEVPGLLFNPTSNAFTLRADTKRVSTLKSLTPKRNSEKNKSPVKQDKSI